MITYYYTLNETTKQLERLAPPFKDDQGLMILHPTPEQFAERGGYPKKEGPYTPPPVADGMIAVPDSWAVENGEWTRTWRIEPAPPPTPRIFSKLKLEAVLFQEGLLEQVDQFVDSQEITNQFGQTMPMRRLYETANDFAEDNENFSSVIGALQQVLGIDSEKVEEILAASVAER